MRSLDRLGLRRLLLACAGIVTVFGQGWQPAGALEGRMGYIRDTSRNAGGYYVYLQRLQWGLAGSLSEKLNWNWEITAGGILQGASVYNRTVLTPEYHLQSQLRPFKPISLSLFSYYQVTDPVRFMVDSLVRTEWVNGLRLDTRLPGQTRLGIGVGYRTQQQDTLETARQFIRAQLEKRLLGLNFRLTGERDDWQKQRLGANPEIGRASCRERV